MTKGVWLETDNEGADRYNSALEDRLSGQDIPRGLLLHIAAGDDRGWHTVEIWDAEQDFLHFLHSTRDSKSVEPQLFEPTSMLQFTTIDEDADLIAVVLRTEAKSDDAQAAVVERLSLPGSRMPDGGRYHVGGLVGDDWRAIEVWETRQAFDAVLDDELRSSLAKTGAALDVEELPVRKVVAYTDLRPFLGE